MCIKAGLCSRKTCIVRGSYRATCTLAVGSCWFLPQQLLFCLLFKVFVCYEGFQSASVSKGGCSFSCRQSKLHYNTTMQTHSSTTNHLKHFQNFTHSLTFGTNFLSIDWTSNDSWLIEKYWWSNESLIGNRKFAWGWDQRFTSTTSPWLYCLR